MINRLFLKNKHLHFFYFDEVVFFQSILYEVNCMEVRYTCCQSFQNCLGVLASLIQKIEGKRTSFGLHLFCI